MRRRSAGDSESLADGVRCVFQCFSPSQHKSFSSGFLKSLLDISLQKEATSGGNQGACCSSTDHRRVESIPFPPFLQKLTYLQSFPYSYLKDNVFVVALIVFRDLHDLVWV